MGRVSQQGVFIEVPVRGDMGCAVEVHRQGDVIWVHRVLHYVEGGKDDR